MASHLLFFRLPKGRVWHVACSGSPVALCGQPIPERGERQPKRPPLGARPCPDCSNVSVEAEYATRKAFDSSLPAGPRPLTDPDDDGDLPDLLGQDGEARSI